ncbi:unnamed protein product, partial [Rotaria magnacalcarata]
KTKYITLPISSLTGALAKFSPLLEIRIDSGIKLLSFGAVCTGD